MNNAKPAMWKNPVWAITVPIPECRFERMRVFNFFMTSSRRITRLEITLDIFDNTSKRYPETWRLTEKTHAS